MTAPSCNAGKGGEASCWCRRWVGEAAGLDLQDMGWERATVPAAHLSAPPSCCCCCVSHHAPNSTPGQGPLEAFLPAWILPLTKPEGRYPAEGSDPFQSQRDGSWDCDRRGRKLWRRKCYKLPLGRSTTHGPNRPAHLACGLGSFLMRLAGEGPVQKPKHEACRETGQSLTYSGCEPFRAILYLLSP